MQKSRDKTASKVLREPQGKILGWTPWKFSRKTAGEIHENHSVKNYVNSRDELRQKPQEELLVRSRDNLWEKFREIPLENFPKELFHKFLKDSRTNPELLTTFESGRKEFRLERNPGRFLEKLFEKKNPRTPDSIPHRVPWEILEEQFRMNFCNDHICFKWIQIYFYLLISKTTCKAILTKELFFKTTWNELTMWSIQTSTTNKKAENIFRMYLHEESLEVPHVCL